MIKSLDIALPLSLLFVMSSLFNSGDLATGAQKKSEKTTNCGKYRIKKRSNSLFQDVKALSLNCDSTFSYRHSNCIHPETSEGIWAIKGNNVMLSTNNKIKRLAAKQKKTKTGYNYLNLDGVTLTISDSLILWQRTDQLTDTLERE